MPQCNGFSVWSSATASVSFVAIARRGLVESLGGLNMDVVLQRSVRSEGALRKDSRFKLRNTVAPSARCLRPRTWDLPTCFSRRVAAVVTQTSKPDVPMPSRSVRNDRAWRKIRSPHHELLSFVVAPAQENDMVAALDRVP